MGTDNFYAESKLLLRREFLRAYHVKQKPLVLDCCCAHRMMWTTLRKEFKCDYVGVDVARKANTVVIDSIRLLEQPGLRYDVIDIDTYGSPWKHWKAMLPNLTKSVTVFLTMGQTMQGGGSYDRTMLELACVNLKTKLPGTVGVRVVQHIRLHAISSARGYGFEVDRIAEATGHMNAKYFGVRLRKLGRK